MANRVGIVDVTDVEAAAALVEAAVTAAVRAGAPRRTAAPIAAAVAASAMTDLRGGAVSCGEAKAPPSASRRHRLQRQRVRDGRERLAEKAEETEETPGAGAAAEKLLLRWCAEPPAPSRAQRGAFGTPRGSPRVTPPEAAAAEPVGAVAGVVRDGCGQGFARAALSVAGEGPQDRHAAPAREAPMRAEAP